VSAKRPFPIQSCSQIKWVQNGSGEGSSSRGSSGSGSEISPGSGSAARPSTMSIWPARPQFRISRSASNAGTSFGHSARAFSPSGPEEGFQTAM